MKNRCKNRGMHSYAQQYFQLLGVIHLLFNEFFLRHDGGQFVTKPD